MDLRLYISSVLKVRGCIKCKEDCAPAVPCGAKLRLRLLSNSAKLYTSTPFGLHLIHLIHLRCKGMKWSGGAHSPVLYTCGPLRSPAVNEVEWNGRGCIVHQVSRLAELNDSQRNCMWNVMGKTGLIFGIYSCILKSKTVRTLLCTAGDRRCTTVWSSEFEKVRFIPSCIPVPSLFGYTSNPQIALNAKM